MEAGGAVTQTCCGEDAVSRYEHSLFFIVRIVKGGLLILNGPFVVSCVLNESSLSSLSSLFKNVTLTVVVVPLASHRAIYFAAYSTAKEKLNGVLEPDSTQVHMVSAGMAGNYTWLPCDGALVAGTGRKEGTGLYWLSFHRRSTP